jgi:hypothetical protein
MSYEYTVKKKDEKTLEVTETSTVTLEKGQALQMRTNMLEALKQISNQQRGMALEMIKLINRVKRINVALGSDPDKGLEAFVREEEDQRIPPPPPGTEAG